MSVCVCVLIHFFIMHSLSLFRSRPLLRVCSPSQWSRFFTSVSRPTPSPVGVAPIAIHQSMTTDPFFNLAYEAELFSSFQQQLEENPSGGIKHLLYVWCNGPSVIIGKHQNPYKECHLQKLEEQGVKLVRRHSGGGAVYQGNVKHTHTHTVETKEGEQIEQERERGGRSLKRRQWKSGMLVSLRKSPLALIALELFLSHSLVCLMFLLGCDLLLIHFRFG